MYEIQVRRQFAYLIAPDNPPVLTADLTAMALSFADGKASGQRAFQEGRWDGLVNLASGNKFPAGLSLRLRDHIVSLGYPCEIVYARQPDVDVSAFASVKVKGIDDMWAWQEDGCQALLRADGHRGVCRIPTSGGKTAMVARLCLFFARMGMKCLVVTSRKGLCKQTRKEFEAFYGHRVPVGQWGDGVKAIKQITVATAQGMVKGLDSVVIRQLLSDVSVLIADECHHTGADGWYAVAMACSAPIRYALSGTPFVGDDLRDAKLIGAFGPLVYHCDTQEIIAAKKAARPKYVIVAAREASHPELPTRQVLKTHPVTKERYPVKVYPDYADAYRVAIAESRVHNKAVIDAAMWMVARKRRVLILTRLKDQFSLLDGMLRASRVAYRAIWGDHSTVLRDDAKALLNEGSIRVLLATTILDEGESVKGIDGIVLAEGVKSMTSISQRLGRGMRLEFGGFDDVWVVDFASRAAPVLFDHAIKRVETVEADGHQVFLQETWTPGPDLLPFERWDDLFPPAREKVVASA